MFYFLASLYPATFNEPRMTRGERNYMGRMPTRFHARPEVEASKYDARDVIEDLAREANAHGVTLYPLHGGPIAGADLADVTNARSRSLSNVLVDFRQNTELAMRVVAEETGGRVSLGSVHDDLFAGIRTDISAYYSLGFRSTTTGDHEIRVRVRKPGRYTVRHRHSFRQKPADEAVADRVVANLFTTTQTGEGSVGLTIGAGTPAPNGKIRVPVRIDVPYDWLTLLDKGGHVRWRVRGLHRGGRHDRRRVTRRTPRPERERELARREVTTS